MRGYSQNIVEANQAATKTLGVNLGAICIALKYPASQVAKQLGISRQTVYDWFSGKTKPHKEKELIINNLINKLNSPQ